MKFAIIENEYGAIDIDTDLVQMSVKEDSMKEEIVEMINGCICCNVRGDLIPVVKKLLARHRRDPFDGILIETTGMADPSPVIQTFFLDDDLAGSTEVDGVITVVDAKHVIQHLHEEKEEGAINESEQQIAFADKILLNKTDLVSKKEIHNVKTNLRYVNPTAEIIETHMSVVEPERLIGMKGFNLERALEFDPEFLNKEDDDEEDDEEECQKGCCDTPKEGGCPSKTTKSNTNGCGSKKKNGKKKTNNSTQHDTRISSVAFSMEDDVNVGMLQTKLNDELQNNSDKLYRYKGVVSVKGMKEKFVFQGVHMLLTGGFMPGSCWKPNEPRVSKFVFIGVDLDHAFLKEVFESCKAQPLRLNLGSKVWCNAGEWSKGTVIKLWDQGNPYRIRLDPEYGDGREVFAPEDDDIYLTARTPQNENSPPPPPMMEDYWALA